MTASADVGITTVMTYNILFGGNGRLQLLARVIDQVRPDILALVEAPERGTLQQFARRIQMHCAVGPCWGGQPVAILSPHAVRPVVGLGRPPGVSRSLVAAVVELPGGTERLVVATHLSARLQFSRGDGVRRVAEARAVLAALAPYRDTPHLLVGDFNATAPGEPLARHRPCDTGDRYGERTLPARLHAWVQRQIARTWVWPLVRPLVELLPPPGVIDSFLDAGYVDCFTERGAGKTRHTWPSWSPVARIDFILAHPSLREKLVECRIVDGPPASGASDHLPVAARFRP
ncbi:MAG: endonuclease/exonuclease/phosphatase family protein [Chloroflexi bacterium]|nr:endonuclease/exonuclease/phosphatase family protein [Chloroflexota bacterium]